MPDADPRLSIGANGPPPVEAHRLHIEELLAEAQNFLDGQPIATEGQASAVTTLLNKLREARKGADEQRAIEKRPHDDAAKAVQTAWKPIIDSADLAASVAKQALAPWLEAQEAEAQAAAMAARRLADEKVAAARAALGDQTTATNLASRQQTETLLKAANTAERAANRAEKAKPMAFGQGRAVSLRSVWTATLVDPVAALKFYKVAQGEALKVWLGEQADRDVRAGQRAIPGFRLDEQRTAQ